MTQIGELAFVNTVDESSDDKCPFCYAARHPSPSRKQTPSTKVKSKPNQLACGALPVLGLWRHTTAKHHLISAIQCYSKVRRLVRMASMVGYDVNDPPNGVGLPTVANNITYTVNDDGPKKFGKFGFAEKTEIAFNVMRQAGAQWHVGHHAFDVDFPDDWADEIDASFLGHTSSYDQAVIQELLKIMDAWVKEDFCKEEDDQSTSLKADMDQLSKKIRDKLGMFGKGMPRKSTPYFVSQLAFNFADAEGSIDSNDDNPAPKKKVKQ